MSSSSGLPERTRRRVDRRLMPFIFLLFTVSYLDRVNVGSAALQMSRELGFTDSVFGFGGGIFFLGYILLEIPGGILAEVWSARKWIARILLTWGVISSLTGFVQTAHQFYWIRFLLGVAEAGFVPAILVYLSHWYRAEDRGKAIAIFFTAIPASQVIGGPIASLLLRIHWLGLSGWRWLLILEGIPALILGVITLYYLTERPQDAKWLPAEERDWLVGELAKERAERRGHDSIARALVNPHVLLLCAVLFLGLNANYGVSLWLPQMMQRVSHYDVSTVSLIASIPSFMALPFMLLNGWHSDHTGERIWHTCLPRLLSALSLLACFFTLDNTWGSVFLLSLATIGFYCAHPGFWPLPNMLLGRTAAAASLGLINSFGSLGGFAGSYMLGRLNDRSGGLGAGLLYVAACSFASGLLVLLLRGAVKKTVTSSLVSRADSASDC
ncbi:MAG: MFS transporter [Bryobacterales bacterium]|nr:MFS transporter [Bryobacterales bacterium]